MSSECLFCSIVAGDAPAQRVAEGDRVVAFRDIAPRAPVHVLVVPYEHIDSAHAITEEHTELLGRCFAMARKVAELENTADGYRVTTNVGTRGGQAIKHLHFHVIGGRRLGAIDSGDPPR